jgi:hypothetical protein
MREATRGARRDTGLPSALVRFCDERRETIQREGASALAKKVQRSPFGVLIESQDLLLAKEPEV